MREPPAVPCSEERLEELLEAAGDVNVCWPTSFRLASPGELAWLISEARDARALRLDVDRLRERRSEDQLHMVKVARLLDEAATAAYREREFVSQIRESLKAADVHECYRGVRAALEHYDDRRERGGE